MFPGKTVFTLPETTCALTTTLDMFLFSRAYRLALRLTHWVSGTLLVDIKNA